MREKPEPQSPDSRGGVLFAIAYLALAAWAMVDWWRSSAGPHDPASLVLFLGREGMLLLVIGPLLVLALVAGLFGAAWRWTQQLVRRVKRRS